MFNQEVTYFIEPGRKNTIQTLRIAREYAAKKGIKKILVASTYGYTIGHALEIFNGTDTKFIVVGGERSQFPDSLRERLVEGDHMVIFNSEYDFRYPSIVWEILRRFCEGMKVCVEMTLKASDLGLLPIGEEVIAVAGTGPVDFPDGGGADTAVVVEAVRSADFFRLDLPQSRSKLVGRKIKEILCKPR